MSRAATLGNGNILVGLDRLGQVRDFYYPYVGHSNHVSGASGNYVHRIGVYVDDAMRWLEDPTWDVVVGCGPESVIGCMSAHNKTHQMTLGSMDAVHNEDNIFLRKFTLKNEAEEAREFKLMFSQQFRIAESRRGDTGFFDPRVNAIIHYKGTDVFLVNAYHGNRQFEEYNIGLFGIEGKEGTYLDAEDGFLQKNPVEHGSVDSVIAVSVTLTPGEETEVMYYITCGASVAEVHDLHARVIEETPEVLIKSAERYWKAWIRKEDRDISLLPGPLQALYKRSLTTIRVHCDNRGGIIASSDTDMLHHGRDTYAYVWPRDGAIIAHALDENGYLDAAKMFFKFTRDCLERGGYLMHKYRSDGVLGSSWHPWMIEGKAELPIQEDETALVLYMLWQHYQKARDLEYIESMYNTFIEPAANFMVDFIEPEFGLPKNSYDLWEEKFGISTYTASAVFGALSAAEQFAGMLGKDEPARTYGAVAGRMQKSILEHLYDPSLGMFIKLIRVRDDREPEYDRTVDMSSFFGPIYFGVLPVDDVRVTTAYETVEKTLRVLSASEGYVRYQNDSYYKMRDSASPNPWVITSLWMAQYHIMRAKKLTDLDPARDLLEWTCGHATVGGVLSEQMHPDTRAHLSTAPLIWSHAEFVLTAGAYIEKYNTLKEERG